MKNPQKSVEFERQRSILSEMNENILLYDGYEDALVGFVERFGESPVAVYDKNMCLTILIDAGMKPEEAQEWFDYNTLGAGCGPETPVFITFLKDIE